MMKVKKGLGAELQSEVAKGLLQRRNNQKAEENRAEQSKTAPEARVQIGLARAINSELNPEELLAERKERVARLKEAVQNGTYNPPLDQVAERLYEESFFDALANSGE